MICPNCRTRVRPFFAGKTFVNQQLQPQMLQVADTYEHDCNQKLKRAVQKNITKKSK